ncbi:hypothetical protein C8R45DRAFT_1070247 [Mycena sanguinolenta]|nr:hypothetical protein C8R45DRAFT_1070247 [Mycena sanguinolenta]
MDGRNGTVLSSGLGTTGNGTFTSYGPAQAMLVHAMHGSRHATARHRSDVAVLPRDDIMYRQVLPIVACLRVVLPFTTFYGLKHRNLHLVPGSIPRPIRNVDCRFNRSLLIFPDYSSAVSAAQWFW